jgi:hypothetical protein
VEFIFALLGLAGYRVVFFYDRNSASEARFARSDQECFMSLLSENSCACSLRDCCDMFDVISLQLNGNLNSKEIFHCAAKRKIQVATRVICVSREHFSVSFLWFSALLLSH